MGLAAALSVRERKVAGGLRDAVDERPAGFASGRSRLVVMIHGYNNTEDAARQAYEEMVRNLERLGPAAAGFIADMAGFYWPGDAGLGFLSGASYPWEIRPAKDSAERLAAFLGTLAGPGGGPIEVYLVCHSLGNRVGLELLRLLAAGRVSGTVVERGSCLMAAAVPVFMAQDGGRLEAATRLTRTLALYSPDDKVLSGAFPAGQTLAGEGFFPEAIGHQGKPVQRWSARRRMLKDGRSGYGHGDYWRDRNTAPEVARFLGAVLPNEIAASAISDRALPEAGRIAAGAIDGRTLPARPAFG